jgi:hypothetical protein
MSVTTRIRQARTTSTTQLLMLLGSGTTGRAYTRASVCAAAWHSHGNTSRSLSASSAIGGIERPTMHTRIDFPNSKPIRSRKVSFHHEYTSKRLSSLCTGNVVHLPSFASHVVGAQSAALHSRVLIGFTATPRIVRVARVAVALRG